MPYQRKSTRKGSRKASKTWRKGAKQSYVSVGRTNMLLGEVKQKKYTGVKYFTELTRFSPLTSSGAAGSGKFYVRMTDLPNSLAQSAVFDKYCITRFDVIIYPKNTLIVADQTVTGLQPMPTITYAVNRDGGANVLTEASILGEDNAERASLSGVEPIIIPVTNCRPWTGLTAQNGGTTTNTFDLMGNQKLWFDFNGSEDANIYYYGVNYWLNPGSVPIGASIADVYIRAYYMCKEQQ